MGKVREEFEKKFKGDIGVSLAGLDQPAPIDGSFEEVWDFIDKALSATRKDVLEDFVKRVCSKWSYLSEFLPNEMRYYLKTLKKR